MEQPAHLKSSRLVTLDDLQKIQYWLDKFGCNAKELGKAIVAVGHSEHAIRTYLKK